MAKGDDVRERLVKFGVLVIDLCERLPKTQAASHISLQRRILAASVYSRYEAEPAE